MLFGANIIIGYANGWVEFRMVKSLRFSSLQAKLVFLGCVSYLVLSVMFNLYIVKLCIC